MNENSIINEICYYFGLETKDDEKIDEKEIKNIIILMFLSIKQKIYCNPF